MAHKMTSNGFSFVLSISSTLLAHAFICIYAKPAAGMTVPDFGKMYHVKGVISLPSYEIEEPFEAWFDFEGNRSRIDYYNSTTRTFLIGNDLDYGAIYQIKPVLPPSVIRCFQLKGTKEEPIRPQSAMPDAQGFEFEKMDYHKGTQCEVWKIVSQVGHKKNTYRLWVTRPQGNDAPATPHRFEMEGFNSLLDSHNDKYSIEYSDFSSQTEPDVFTPPAGFTCEEFPDPPEEHQILANPFQDYVSTNPVSHAHRMFGPFKEKFNRQYESEEEHEKREINFVQSFRFVNSTNRRGLSFTVGINKRADWSRAETRKYC